MTGPLTGKETGLVAYWNFEGGNAKDSSKNGNNGYLLSTAKIALAPPPSAEDTH